MLQGLTASVSIDFHCLSVNGDWSCQTSLCKKKKEEKSYGFKHQCDGKLKMTLIRPSHRSVPHVYQYNTLRL